MSRYPILVERFESDKSMTIVCEACDAERVISDDEISNEMLYGCPAGCGELAVYKYDEGTRCEGCGDLHWDIDLIERKYCSRRCKLQADYAAQIQSRGGTGAKGAL